MSGYCLNHWHLAPRSSHADTAKTGKALVTALLRSESQGETLWANAVALDEAAQAELMRLKAGESLFVQGKQRVAIYEKRPASIS
jgi:hypothetical protein